MHTSISSSSCFCCSSERIIEVPSQAMTEQQRFNDEEEGLPPGEATLKTKMAPWPFQFWTQWHLLITALGCTSSCIVLAVRLVLDHSPTVYVIHSVIIFFDMILIHVFTHDLWLSISGEVLTVIFFVSYHFTKESLYELLETTLLAMLVSLNLIGTRKQVMQERNELKDHVSKLERRGSILVLMMKEENDDEIATRRNTEVISKLKEMEGITSSEEMTHSEHYANWFQRYSPNETNGNPPKDPFHRCEDNLCFQYFLDGAAGVLYTSFIGLIIDQIIHYGSKKQSG